MCVCVCVHVCVCVYVCVCMCFKMHKKKNSYKTVTVTICLFYYSIYQATFIYPDLVCVRVMFEWKEINRLSYNITHK